MTDSFTHNSEELRAWSYLITKGITNAISDIVPTEGQGITIDSIKLGQVVARDVPELLGGPESLAIGIYSALSGTVNGHLMIAHRPELPFTVMNIHPNTPNNLSEKDQCTLGEIENGMRNAFLGAIEDTLEIPLHPSSPIVLLDKAAALLNIAKTRFLNEDDLTFVVETMLTIHQQATRGLFVIMLDHNLMQLAQQLSAKV